MVGGDYVQKNLRSLANDGRMSQIAFLQSSVVEIDMRLIMMKRLTVTGSTLRASPTARKVALAQALAREGLAAVRAGQAQGRDRARPTRSRRPRRRTR